MQLNINEYHIESTPGGEFCAYLVDYHQCWAYGETPEEALDALSDVADEFFGEVDAIYQVEEFA